MRLRLPPLLIAAIVFGACTEGSDPDVLRPRRPVASPTSETTAVIGLVGSMSGPESWRGTDAFEGAQFGVQALNRNLDDDAARYELVTLDDRGDPKRASSLVAELAANPRTAGVVYAGPMLGLARAHHVLEQAGIPGILCYGDLYSARLLRSHVFQVSPPYLWQARVMTSYLTGDRRYRRIGALVENTLEGRTAKDALRTALAEAGAREPVVQRFPPAAASIRFFVEELRKRDVQAIALLGSPRMSDAFVALLGNLGHGYRSSANARASGRGKKEWRPQVIGFDQTIHSTDVSRPAGTVAADSYARGAHYLPVPSLAAFRKGFVDWWGEPPLGWEVRAFQAVQMIGWASLRTDPEGDVAATLERLRGARYGGLDITFGPDDHTSVDQTTIGLWAVPRPGADVPERDRLPDSMPWVPLARTFSIDGERTDVLPEDWAHLFRGQTRQNRPSPKFERMRFGVTTPRSDPVH